MLIVVIFNVAMLGVVMLNVVMLSVVAPRRCLTFYILKIDKLFELVSLDVLKVVYEI